MPKVSEWWAQSRNILQRSGNGCGVRSPEGAHCPLDDQRLRAQTSLKGMVAVFARPDGMMGVKMSYVFPA